MIKKIKRYFKLQRQIQKEVVETLASICLFLEYDAHVCYHGRYDGHFRSHFNMLKWLSRELEGGTENGTDRDT